MNQSEQIREKLTALSELDGLFNSLLFERDKEASLSILSEAEEQIKTLIGSIEEVRHLIERGHARIQDGLRSHECAPSHRENRLEDDVRKVESPSLSYEEPPVDTTSMGMPQASTVVYYIDDSNHNSNEGYYKDNPNEDTRFQITVDQTDPYVGILQFYDRIEEGVKKEFKQASLSLINNVRGQYPGSNTSGSIKDGEVRLDPERKHWELKTPITIKS